MVCLGSDRGICNQSGGGDGSDQQGKEEQEDGRNKHERTLFTQPCCVPDSSHPRRPITYF